MGNSGTIKSSQQMFERSSGNLFERGTCVILVTKFRTCFANAKLKRYNVISFFTREYANIR